MTHTFVPQPRHSVAAPLDIGAMRRQLMAQRGHMSEAASSGAQPIAPQYAVASANHAPAPQFAPPPSFVPDQASQESASSTDLLQLPTLPPSLNWLVDWWHIIAAVMAGLIVFAVCNVPGLMGEEGLGLAAAGAAGAVAGGSAFLYLRRVRRSVVRALANFNESSRSTGFWAVFAVVFAAVVGLSVYGVMSAGPEAEAMSLGGWAFVGIKGGALAAFIARFAQKKFFDPKEA